MVNTLDQVFRTKYRDEFVMDFERDKSYLMETVSSDGTIDQGTSTVAFDIVDPGDEMVDKGRDGKIPSSDAGFSQVTAALARQHKKYKIDNFDKFRANPNSMAAMQKRGVGAANRAIDKKIIAQLDTATQNMGAANILSTLAEVLDWTSTLWEQDVPNDGNVYGLLTVRAWAQMMRITEFKSRDYIIIGAVEKGAPAGTGQMREWMGVKWMMHTGLTGARTASAKCYIYHKSCIGHKIDGMPSPHFFGGDDDEDDNSGVRYSITHTAKKLLDRGIVQYVHNDTTALTA